ncbi:unnamed protein product [Alopecurus aequalis]
MENWLKAVAALVVVTAIHLLSRSRSGAKKKLPPGSLGLPVIGQTLSVVRAWRANNMERWILDRIHRYGPVSKLSIFFTPTVLVAGPAANKFMLFSSELRVMQADSFTRLVGERSIVDLQGEDHRRVRGALMEFLKPDMLKRYIGRIDAEVRRHLGEEWNGRTTVTVLPLMKRLTFDIIADLLFGLESGAVRDALAHDFDLMVEAVFAIPVNLPFTTFSRSLKASQRARRVIEGMTRNKKAELLRRRQQGEEEQVNNDLLTRLLSLRDDHGEQLLTNEEILDNGMLGMLAGFDATAVLITFIVRQLGSDPATLATMVQEHEEIARNKQAESLTWEDLSKMKFTWRVAQETLRLVPPTFGIIRRALDDIELDGYCIPKGWQVCLATHVTHMDPSIFHEPAKFDPSRFENHPSAVPPCSYIPFGGGPRICPGVEFIRIETLVTMHNLVRRFRWKLCCPENTYARDPLPSPLHGLPIQLTAL